MSRESNISSKNKSTVPADVIASNLHYIDKVECCRERIAIAPYYRAEKYGFKSGREDQG